jgi:hypothetical protein
MVNREENFSVIWSFGGNYVRLYRGGKAKFESSQEEVHKRGGLWIEQWNHR